MALGIAVMGTDFRSSYNSTDGGKRGRFARRNVLNQISESLSWLSSSEDCSVF